MTTLNARANQAYHAVADEWNREHPDWEWMGYDHQRDAFEDGWERGYKTASEEAADEIERCALVLATENDESGNYLVAAVLKKAADIVRTNAANGGVEKP